MSAQIGYSGAAVTQFEAALATSGLAIGQQSEHPSSSAFMQDHGLNGSLLLEGTATDLNGSLDDSSNHYTSSSKQQWPMRHEANAYINHGGGLDPLTSGPNSSVNKRSPGLQMQGHSRANNVNGV